MNAKLWMVALLLAGCAETGDEAGVDDLEALASDGKDDSVAKPAPAALKLTHALELDPHRGKPLLQVMLLADQGIKANLDDDYLAQYPFADWNHVHDALYNFDSKVVSSVLNAFSNRATGLKALVVSLKGKSFTPATIVSVLFATPNHGHDVYAVAQVLAMASGAGTLVHLDAKTYYYNYGYAPGTNVEEDVKTGRSFGASIGHPANDASDVFYLKELQRYLSGNTDVRPLYQTLAEILTLSRADGIADLSALGQAVTSDFTAIYTAESDRHVMSSLRAHAWENDLAEVTFVAAFGTTVGKVMKDKKLIDGTADLYWAKSATSGRSGIGETRSDRRALQRLITSYERTHHPELVTALETAVNHKSSDVFRATMEALNSGDFLSDPSGFEKLEGADITQALSDLLVQVRADAPAMLATPAFQAVM